MYSIYLLSVQHVSFWTGVVFKQLAYSATKWFLSQPWLLWVSEALTELSHWTPCLLECSYGALLIRLICRAARLLLICALWCNMYQILKCLILLLALPLEKKHISFVVFFLLSDSRACEFYVEQMKCSKMSAHKIHMVENHPKKRIQYLEHGESLKSRIYYLVSWGA